MSDHCWCCTSHPAHRKDGVCHKIVEGYFRKPYLLKCQDAY